jgi:DNA-binding transcriptional LysR family regulator
MYPLILEDIADFRQAYPKVVLDILITNLPLNLDTLDADLAIRATLNPPPSLVGRCASNLAFAIYGAKSLQENSVFGPIDKAPWLGLNGPLANSVPGKWLSEAIPDDLVTIRCSSFIALLEMVQQGLGFAVLPCYLGDKSAAIGRVLPDTLAFHNQIWLLAHSDVLRSQKVQACMSFFYQSLRAKRRILEGLEVS